MNIDIKKVLMDIRSVPSIHNAKLHDIEVLLHNADCARFDCTGMRASAQEFSIIIISYQSGACIVDGYIAIPHTIDLSNVNKSAITLRGGSNDFGKIKEGYLYNPSTYFSWMPLDGYVTFYTQYRNDADGVCKDEMGGSDIQDVLMLQSIMQHLTWCDSDNVTLLGWSRGGQMIYQILRSEKWVSNAIAIAAPANHVRMIESGFRLEWESHMEKMCGGSKKSLEHRSASYWANEMHIVPLLLIHGDADERVSVQDSKDMNALLPQSDLYIVKDGTHSLADHKDFLRKYIHTWLINRV